MTAAIVDEYDKMAAVVEFYGFPPAAYWGLEPDDLEALVRHMNMRAQQDKG